MRRTMSLVVCGALIAAAGCSKESRKEESGSGSEAAMKAGPAERPASRRRAAPPRKVGPRLTQVWEATGLEVPESVMYDPAAKALYVSCINGKPTEKNGQGFVARLSPDGKVQTLKWVKGMNAPKGMGLEGTTLYVTDIDRLHVIDTKTGKITRTVDAPGAKFLNDIAVAPDGRVFVSDMVTGKVHVLADGKLALFADLKPLEGSNGMLMHTGRLLVGTATGIATIDLETAKPSLLVPVKGFGMIDGLKAYGADAYLMSNWTGRTQLVDGKGNVTVLLDTSAKKIQSADLEYLAAKRLLLIPTFFDNRVVAYRLDK